MVSLPIELAGNHSVEIRDGEWLAKIPAETAGFRTGTPLSRQTGHGDRRSATAKPPQHLQTLLTAHTRSDLDIQQEEIRTGDSCPVPRKQVVPARKTLGLETKTFEHQNNEISDGIIIIHDKNQTGKPVEFRRSTHRDIFLNTRRYFHKIPSALPILFPFVYFTRNCRFWGCQPIDKEKTGILRP